MPGRCSCSYSPENGRSVAFSRSTAYCVGVSSLRHSASVFSSFAVLVSVIVGFPFLRHPQSSTLQPVWIPGPREDACPGMTIECSVGDLRAIHQRRLLDVILRENLLQGF